MPHKEIGISLFEEDLREAMSNRITQFVDHIVKDPNKHKMKSMRQWTLEFKEWSEQKFFESEILKYLKDVI